MIVAGSMIGTGIFIVSADMARELGSPGWLLVAWVITGVLTIAAALSYGELAAMMPRAGGQSGSSPARCGHQRNVKSFSNQRRLSRPQTNEIA